MSGEGEPLQPLVSRGDVDGVKALLKKIREQNGEEAVITEILNCEFGDRNTKSALHCAGARGRAEILKLPLAEKADPNAMDDAGNTPLHFAADLGHARAARALLEAGGRADAGNNFGRTPLENAQAKSWDSAASSLGKGLVRKMCAGNFEDAWDDLPAEPAVSVARAGVGKADTSSFKSASQDKAESLATKKADEESDAKKFEDDVAAQRRNSDAEASTFCLSICGTMPDNLSIPDSSTIPDLDDGAPAEPRCVTLAQLVKNSDLAGVQARLEEIMKVGGVKRVIGAVSSSDGGVPDDEDARVAYSALHCAAAMGSVEILRVLLATHADPNTVNEAGNTPLHFAADMGEDATVQILLNAGADPDIRNNFGRSPEDFTEPRPSESEELRSRKRSVRSSLVMLR
mmetsp:Transcript_113163/g.205826  ORF Transcript_113163/g.205826 Transcript_113163/m.205826 type:complete len:402 (+) Transcript_113163:85-1290(+)